MKPKRWRLKNLKLDRVDLVTAGANPGASVLIAKFETPPDGDVSNAVEPNAIVEVEVSDQIETVEAPDAPVEEVSMSDEPQVETVAKADFEALQKANTELSDRIAKMERDAKQAEYVAKAREYSNLGKADELGALLLAASEAFSAEQYQTLERLLKAANAQVDKGELFAQFSQPTAEAGSFDEKLTGLAKAKVEAGAAPTLEIAKLQVLNENPELRAEYRNSR